MGTNLRGAIAKNTRAPLALSSFGRCGVNVVYFQAQVVYAAVFDAARETGSPASRRPAATSNSIRVLGKIDEHHRDAMLWQVACGVQTLLRLACPDRLRWRRLGRSTTRATWFSLTDHVNSRMMASTARLSPASRHSTFSTVPAFSAFQRVLHFHGLDNGQDLALAVNCSRLRSPVQLHQ